MPLLLKAVPLVKEWYGVHYWNTPSMQDLPVELEYISLLEFEDRFAQLNKIARSKYPTFWPNVAVSLVFIAVTAAATIGIMHAGTNLAIMGQGACFVLPVLVVVWYKIRKEINEIAIKKFKHRSQRLLRAWTNQDTTSHAIQWKLRLRPEMVARQSLQAQRHPLLTYHSQLGQSQIGGWQHSTPDLIPARVQQQEQQPQQPQQLLVLHNLESPLDQESASRAAFNSPGGSIARVESAEEALDGPPPAQPSSVVQIYQTLRINTRRLSRAMSPEAQLEEQRPIPVVRTTTTSSALLRGDTDEEAYSYRTSLRSMFKSIRCCGHFFRERKVWLIEISLREAQLDEYTLTVPSPVYCGYRLPGYDDVMSGNMSTSTASMGASSSRIVLDRYMGSPPDYLSDSEAEDDVNDGEGVDDRRRTSNRVNLAREPRIAAEDSPMLLQSIPEMVMVKLPAELTSVVVMAPTSLHQLAATSSDASGSTSAERPMTRSIGTTCSRVNAVESDADNDGTASTLSLPLLSIDDREDGAAGSSNGKRLTSAHN